MRCKLFLALEFRVAVGYKSDRLVRTFVSIITKGRSVSITDVLSPQKWEKRCLLPFPFRGCEASPADQIDTGEQDWQRLMINPGHTFGGTLDTRLIVQVTILFKVNWGEPCIRPKLLATWPELMHRTELNWGRFELFALQLEVVSVFCCSILWCLFHKVDENWTLGIRIRSD